MRQPTLVLAATSLFALAPLVGCDEQRQGSAQRQLDAAVATINEAQLGFVSDVEESNLAEHRLETLGQAANNLRAVITDGDRDQQVIARRLLADIHATATQGMLRDAGREDAALRLRAGSIITQLGAYELANARVRRFDRDDALMIEQLNEEIREQRGSREQTQQRRERVAGELEQLREQRQQLRDQIDDAHGQARDLRDQAFVAEGDEQYELEEEAAQLVLRAEKQAAEAEQLEGQITIGEADLLLADQRIELIDSLVEELRDQVQKVEGQTAQTADWRDEAEADRNEAFETLREEFEQLIEAYHASVRDRYERVSERADEAADQASQAAQMASGRERPAARAELLARQGDQIRAFVNHADAISGLGLVLGIVVERVEATQPDAVRPFEEGFSDLVDRQERLAEEAELLIDAALELADELLGEGETIAEFAAAHRDWLNAQRDRLRDSRLAG
ncbi:hypothetical protein ACERK3_04105 [Phycisphaerales bacterium AB-hyl4]|uniref:Uncharacterized protein n=1 Tax=Natronomicrosphaera hydrolytica TaxID=3242702 RepID=A0ABV4U299_9BACT